MIFTIIIVIIIGILLFIVVNRWISKENYDSYKDRQYDTRTLKLFAMEEERIRSNIRALKSKLTTAPIQDNKISADILNTIKTFKYFYENEDVAAIKQQTDLLSAYDIMQQAAIKNMDAFNGITMSINRLIRHIMNKYYK